LKEIKSLLEENEDIKKIAKEFKHELQYQKQRENKLMYFLHLLNE